MGILITYIMLVGIMHYFFILFCPPIATFVYNDIMAILVINHFIRTYKVNFYLVSILDLEFTIKKIFSV